MSGEAALKFLLEHVTEVLKDYKHLKAAAGYEFVKLKNELDVLESYLKDADKKFKKTEVWKTMETQIRDIVYEAEDIIETYLTKKAAAKAKIVSRFKEMLSSGKEQQIKFFRQERLTPFVSGIHEAFRNKADGDGSSTSLEVEKDQSLMVQQSLTVTHDQSTEQDFVTTARDQSNKQDDVVDFKDEATIKGYLLEPPEKKLDVISITGMAGLGKTTLAWKIFQDEEIRRKFRKRIWIHVSQNFKRRDVCCTILKKLIRKHMSINEEELIIKTVHGALEKENEEFLLVMDDVWTIQDWELIEEILPKNNEKGKVLVTSRHTDVAKRATNVRRDPLELQTLGPEKSLELLKLKIFWNAKEDLGDLEGIGQAIANKCGGVPLLIVVIGGILKDYVMTRSNANCDEKWLKVLDDVHTILQEGKDNVISKALELSYNALPYDTKECFLYTGLFPPNHEIPASTLTQLWIAEGFIRRDRGGRSFEENAEKNLNALINMNLLMVRKKNLDHVKTCEVHDMVREFCKAKAIEQNLFRVIEKSDEAVSEDPNVRRLCLHSHPSNFLFESPTKTKPAVRSFLCFFKEPFKFDSNHISNIPEAFNLLRVLNCKSITFHQFPKVRKLILLKYITLCIDNLDVLPDLISELLNLQTLIVDTKSSSIKVEPNIWKMVQLRRLKTKAAIFLDDKNWKGRARGNLQTISRLSPESCREDLSERAPDLKILGIQGKVANLFNTSTLVKFRHLEKLKIVNEVPEHPLSIMGPQTGGFPRNLKRLTLSKTKLRWNEHMPILSEINNLKVLKLKDNAFEGAYWTVHDVTVFSKLEFLLIENSGLVIWKTTLTSHFPSLKWLMLKNCKGLEEIPESLAAGNLQKLELEGIKESAVEYAKKIESIINKGKRAENTNGKVPFKLTVKVESVLKPIHQSH